MIRCSQATRNPRADRHRIHPGRQRLPGLPAVAYRLERHLHGVRHCHPHACLRLHRRTTSPYEVGELYLSTATANNLQTTTIASVGTQAITYSGSTTLATSPTYALTTAAPFSSNVGITIAAMVAAAEPAPFQLPRTTWLATLLPLAFFGLKRRKLLVRLSLLLLALTTFGISGCGSSTSVTNSPRLPPTGAQTLTVTATSGTTVMSTPITVTITN